MFSLDSGPPVPGERLRVLLRALLRLLLRAPHRALLRALLRATTASSAAVLGEGLVLWKRGF